MHENPCALWLFPGTVRCCSLLHGVENTLTTTESDEIRCASHFIIKGGIRSTALFCQLWSERSRTGHRGSVVDKAESEYSEKRHENGGIGRGNRYEGDETPYD